MKEIEGDLIKLALENEFDAIIHGCNCFHTMGAGIARTVKQVFPEAYVADVQDTKKGDIDKLGTCSIAEVDRDGVKVTIINAYTQYQYWNEMDVDYDAVRSCMKLIKKKFSGKRIGLPLIGAGEAGGDWDVISAIIEEELVDEDVTLIIWKP